MSCRTESHRIWWCRLLSIGWYLVLVLIPVGSNASDRLSLDGYYKSYFTAHKFPSLEVPLELGGALRFDTDPAPLGSVSNRLRLKLRYHALQWLTIDVAYDLTPRIQDPALFLVEDMSLTGPTSGGFRVDDPPAILYPSSPGDRSSFAIYQNLDRLSASMRLWHLDLVVGRQPIAWGAARVINPTDILAPFSYTDLDVEDRAGVDAVRARLAIGFMAEVDGGLVFGPDFENDLSACYLRGRFYAANTDFSVVFSRFRENVLLGGDIARSIGGAGTWLEAAYIDLDTLDTVDENCSYFALSAGADYSFSDAIYSFAEYHFNGLGKTDPGEYFGLITSQKYTAAPAYLLGRHYVIPGMVYQVDPLWSLSSEAMINLNDGSALLVPRVEYNLAEDIYLSAGAYLPTGAGPGIKYMPDEERFPSPDLGSEFGSYPTSVFTSFRIYF